MVIASLPYFYYNHWATQDPNKTGFYCNDETIALPYKNDTVSFSTTLAFGLSAPLLIVLVVELVVLPIWRKSNFCWLAFYFFFYLQGNIDIFAESSTTLESETVGIIIGYLFGAAASVSLVGIAKSTIGRLRPHFLDVCKPDFSQIECGTFQRPNYITEYHCLGNEELFPSKVPNIGFL